MTRMIDDPTSQRPQNWSAKRQPQLQEPFMRSLFCQVIEFLLLYFWAQHLLSDSRLSCGCCYSGVWVWEKRNNLLSVKLCHLDPSVATPLPKYHFFQKYGTFSFVYSLLPKWIPDFQGGGSTIKRTSDTILSPPWCLFSHATSHLYQFI